MKRSITLVIVFILLGFSTACFAEEDGFLLLKARRDREALAVFEGALAKNPQDMDALWGKAEVFRRARKFQESEAILNEILKQYPQHISSLITLASIQYIYNNFNQATQLVKQALKAKGLDKEKEALCYLVLGAISSGRSSKGWLLAKLKYGTKIHGYFLKASQLAPDLPDTHLVLGTFYLLAPGIAGGNLDQALSELERALKIAPGFASINARLAQAYQKKGDLEKYNFYINKARELDPENEVLKEVQG